MLRLDPTPALTPDSPEWSRWKKQGWGKKKEKRKRENLRRSWSRRKKRLPWLAEEWGFSALLGFGRKEFAVKKSRFGVELNSKRWEADRQFHILRGASCRDVASSLVVTVCLMSINGKMKRRIGFRTIIAKTRGHVLSP